MSNEQLHAGVITFHASYNCGSILQCMALKQVLEKKGLDVDVINYSSKEQRKLYSVFYKKITLKNIVKNILCIRGYRTIKDHYRQYEEYIKRVFDLHGEYLQTSAAIRKNMPQYDMLIAGGDQIWNVNCDDFSEAYFLDFDDQSYKFSYSPSLGATDINVSPHAARYRELLNRFDDLSCREVNGKKRLEQLTGRKVDLVADPTLLLSKEEWAGRIEFPLQDIPDDNIIFYYAFSYSPVNNELIEKMAEERDLTVVVIDAKQWFIKNLDQYKHFVLSRETGPNAFLYLMQHADYVFTTSFHGTAFSLLFHKKFVYLNSKNHEKSDDRTSFLLEQIDLMDHYLLPEEVNWDILDQPTDYGLIDQRINDMRRTANNYIDRNIENAGKRRA